MSLMNNPALEKTQSPSPAADLEGQPEFPDKVEKTPASSFKSLGILNRFLAIWILLVMAVGIILGNFVPSTGPALQRGQFVGVSIPIGMF